MFFTINVTRGKAICSISLNAHNGDVCITTRYIDNNWLLQKRIIVFHLLTCLNLCDNLLQIFNDFGVVNKLLSISFDNAKQNTACIEILIRTLRPRFNSKLFHMQCVCHIFNLVVQDDL